jgi:hypothetical protein
MKLEIILQLKDIPSFLLSIVSSKFWISYLEYYLRIYDVHQHDPPLTGGKMATSSRWLIIVSSFASL